LHCLGNFWDLGGDAMPDRELTYIQPVHLHDHWEAIKPGLEACRKRGEAWIVEDVYHAIKSGQSFLYVASCGFLVLTPQQSYDGNQLFVWCCYAKSEEDPIALFHDQLKEIAHSIGAKRILFGSKRRWDRKLAPYGWEPMTTIYGLEL